MDREKLKEFMPHREPMLLIDEGAATGDNTGTATCKITGDEWFLKGHFPAEPVVPGVMLCEMLAQACCVILGNKIKGSSTYFTGIKDAKFKRKVRPGDTLQIACEITRVKPPFYFARGSGSVGGELCVSGEFSFALVRRE